MLELFDEEDFLEKMEAKVTYFLTDCCKEKYIQGYDGTRLHIIYALHPEERASIVICHGFCEFFGKYHEVTYYFYQQGYSVFFVEHRGHGLSDRSVDDYQKIHVQSFDEYVSDLKCFMDTVVEPLSQTKELYLFAHSMGGTIAALFLEKYPEYFKKAVLSSPLMKLNLNQIPEPIVRAGVWLRVIKKESMEYAAGQHGFDPNRGYEDSSSMSKQRYDYVHNLRKNELQYQTFGGTNGWFLAAMKGYKKAVRNAYKVKIPVLLFQAGLDKLVKPKGQDVFVKRAKNATKIVFPQSKHEIFNATKQMREKYYQIMFSFFS